MWKFIFLSMSFTVFLPENKCNYYHVIVCLKVLNFVIRYEWYFRNTQLFFSKEIKRKVKILVHKLYNFLILLSNSRYFILVLKSFFWESYSLNLYKHLLVPRLSLPLLCNKKKSNIKTNVHTSFFFFFFESSRITSF